MAVNPIRDELFQGCLGQLYLKFVTHILQSLKYGTVKPYLKKIQNIHESCDILLEICLHQHFVTGN